MRRTRIAYRAAIRRCMICNSDPHSDGCPLTQLARLQQENRHLECPLCKAHAVGVNEADFYECRVCHEQFTSGAVYVVVDKNRYYLDDCREPDLVEVMHLDSKGDGDFPIDKKLAKLGEEIERRKAENKK